MLKNISKLSDAYGIKYYWGRFEFANCRGQIHLHLLGITKNTTDKDDGIHTNDASGKETKKKKAKVLAKWARSNFDVNAE